MARGCKLGLAVGLALAASAMPASAGRRPAAPVPPTQEIVVLDPNVDPNGIPAVLPIKRQGRTLIDIPPAVLVHRFYYSGDRSFQAQMLPGGPVVVVVNHPKSGERVYVPVVMPPGAPRVKYHGTKIEYDFGPQSVCIHFGICSTSSVTYRQQGTVVGEYLRKTSASMIEEAKALMERTGIPDAVRELKDTSRQVKGNVIDGLTDARKSLIDTPIKNGVRMLPGANAILPAPQAKTGP